ncbi:hypothetical protein [Sedimentibacter sp.]|uniref:hypothetical protein n=1 Tax=Sedimentibacter sp. TaxID=1960295 RepID=UPI00289CC1D8|nr:hypothetical protein [Sedimentibacter sp.]
MLYNNETTQSINHGNDEIIVDSSSKIIVFDTLDKVIEYADNIVLGTVVMEEDFNNSSSKYTLKVDKNLKYNLDIYDIDVYEKKGKLLIGSRYILFLEELNNPLYSENSYTSFDKNMIIQIEQDTIVTENNVLNKEKDLDKLMESISKSDKITKVRKKDYTVFNTLETTDDLVEKSDYILHLIPVELNRYNKNATEVKANIVQQYKGPDLGSEISVFLPSDIQDMKEYIVFLRDYDGGILPAAREGSIIEIGTPEFEKVINLLDDQI